jgi:hypothetical protein
MRVSREELYELVWSKPMIHVAAHFGVSGSYRISTCRDVGGGAAALHRRKIRTRIAVHPA